jgi:RimJ/RimL family protein N-acetyltransferase
MILNKNTCLFTANLSLVPYRREHVLKYHEWMKNVQLQILTASEELSLEKEFEMQKTWLEDQDKLTFIIHEGGIDIPTTTTNDTELRDITNLKTLEKLFGKMIGDINLFFSTNPIDIDSNPTDTDRVPDEELYAELDVMIAEIDARKKGLGTLACKIMMDYAVKHLKVSKFIVKIGIDNTASMNMFLKLGFQFISRSEIFREDTLYLRSCSLSPVDYNTLYLMD